MGWYRVKKQKQKQTESQLKKKIKLQTHGYEMSSNLDDANVRQSTLLVW